MVDPIDACGSSARRRHLREGEPGPLRRPSPDLARAKSKAMRAIIERIGAKPHRFLQMLERDLVRAAIFAQDCAQEANGLVLVGHRRFPKWRRAGNRRYVIIP